MFEAHFQSFEDRADRAGDASRVTALRAELKRRGLEAAMLLQVHDELLIEVETNVLNEVKQIARDEMERAAELLVPLKADLKWGPNWAQLTS